MKNAFTLIELIFVIVIIGLLAVVAVPKFTNLASNAKKSSIKAVVSSVQNSIENIHGKWLINEDMTSFKAADGSTQNLNSDGYPVKLDDGNSSETKLFKYVLKIPVYACSNSNDINCWKEYDSSKYEYIFSGNKILRLEYNSTTGLLECIDGVNINKSECEKIIY